MIDGVLTWALAMAYLVIAAVWFGSMAYSLTVVQPRADRFFPDVVRREEYLTTLAQGNRWRVVGLIGGLLLTGGAEALLTDGAMALGYAVAVGCDLVAALIFVHVSWRHWPARVFALPEEIPGFQRGLRVRARWMLGLVSSGYLVALGVTAASGVR